MPSEMRCGSGFALSYNKVRLGRSSPLLSRCSR